MESLLNILWAVIALGGLGIWRLRWVHQERIAPRKPMQEWTAFSCAIILLFFAVSLTDDLHSEIVLFDECANGRRCSTMWSCGHHAVPGGPTVSAMQAAVIPRLTGIEQSRAIARISPTQPVWSLSVWADFTSGRAPPAIPL